METPSSLVYSYWNCSCTRILHHKVWGCILRCAIKGRLLCHRSTCFLLASQEESSLIIVSLWKFKAIFDQVELKCINTICSKKVVFSKESRIQYICLAPLAVSVILVFLVHTLFTIPVYTVTSCKFTIVEE